MQDETAQGPPPKGPSKKYPPGQDKPCEEPDDGDVEKRAGVYGLKPDQLLEQSIVVGPGQHVVLSGSRTKADEPGLVRLQPKDIDDVKRWIGVPDHIGAKRSRCHQPSRGIPGVETPSDFRKLDPEQRHAVHELAKEYVHGDSSRVAIYKPSLNLLLDRAVITGIFLRQDIDVHRGAVLEIGRDIRVLFARHIRIFRGGLLKITGDATIDAVTVTGNHLELSTTIKDWLPSFAQLAAAGLLTQEMADG